MSLRYDLINTLINDHGNICKDVTQSASQSLVVWIWDRVFGQCMDKKLYISDLEMFQKFIAAHREMQKIRDKSRTTIETHLTAVEQIRNNLIRIPKVEYMESLKKTSEHATFNCPYAKYAATVDFEVIYELSARFFRRTT